MHMCVCVCVWACVRACLSVGVIRNVSINGYNTTLCIVYLLVTNCTKCSSSLIDVPDVKGKSNFSSFPLFSQPSNLQSFFTSFNCGMCFPRTRTCGMPTGVRFRVEDMTLLNWKQKKPHLQTKTATVYQSSLTSCDRGIIGDWWFLNCLFFFFFFLSTKSILKNWEAPQQSRTPPKSGRLTSQVEWNISDTQKYVRRWLICFTTAPGISGFYLPTVFALLYSLFLLPHLDNYFYRKISMDKTVPDYIAYINQYTA